MHQYELSIHVKETQTVVTEHKIEGVVLNKEQYDNLLKILKPSEQNPVVSITHEVKESESTSVTTKIPTEPSTKESKKDRRSKYTYDDTYILAELAKGRKESSIAKELGIPYQSLHNHVVKLKESAPKEDSKEDA